MTDKFNFRCPPEVRRRMLKLAKRSGAPSLTHLIRRSLAAYELMVEEVESGGRVLLERTEPDGSKTVREVEVLE